MKVQNNVLGENRTIMRENVDQNNSEYEPFYAALRSRRTSTTWKFEESL